MSYFLKVMTPTLLASIQMFVLGTLSPLTAIVKADIRGKNIWCAVCFKIIAQAMDPKNKNRFDLCRFITKIGSIFMFLHKNRPDSYNTKIDPILITQKSTRFL